MQWEAEGGDRPLRLGLYDLNSEFDSIETAALFINPSHGIGPDISQIGENGPSIFPVTSLGLDVGCSAGGAVGAAEVKMGLVDNAPMEGPSPRRASSTSGARRDCSTLFVDI